MNDDLVVIHQPDFIPYLGFFHRLILADVYVVQDCVQFVYGSKAWTNRDKIKTKNGSEWLTIPVAKAHMDIKINEVLISDDNKWRKRHLDIIRHNYHLSPHFNEVYPLIEELYKINTDKLMDFTLASIKMLINLFGIEIKIIIASELNPVGKSNELVADEVQKIGSYRYLSGTGAKDYYDSAVYKNAGIEVIWQNFEHPVYPQQYEGFIPYLSSIDLLLNCGIEKSREVLRSTVK